MPILKIKWLALTALVVALGILFNAADAQAQSNSAARLSVLQSDPNRIVLELNVAGYQARDLALGVGAFTQLTVGDLSQTSEAGKPQLPLKGAMIGIPPGAQATLRILDDQSQTVSLARHPAPAPTNIVEHDPRQPLASTTRQSFVPNSATYSANQFYPAQAAKIGTTGNWRSQHYATVQFYPLQYNPATRQLVFHRRVRVEITLTYPRGQSPATLGSAVNEGGFEPVFQNALANYSTARNWRAPRSSAAPSRTAPTLSGDYYRIGVNADGIYKLTCGQMAAAKGSTLNIDKTKLQLLKQVYTTPVEIAINVVGTGWNSGACNTTDSSDYIEFFGLGVTGKYTDTNVYWLTVGSTDGKRITQLDGTPVAGTTASSYTQTIHLEKNMIYRSYAPFIEGIDHWYWQYMNTGETKNYGFSADSLASGSFSATFKSVLIGNGPSSTHNTNITLNSCLAIDSGTWYTTNVRTSAVQFSQSCLTAGANNLAITESGNGYIYTDAFDISYQRTFDAITDSLRFQQPMSDTWQYQINGFSSSSIETFDITDYYNVAQIISNTTSGGGPYALQFTQAITSPHEYISLEVAQRKTPSVALASQANLRCVTPPCSPGADYIIITHSSFMTNTKLVELKNLRATQFSRVKLIDVQNIYDEFNDGIVDPQAIRDFLQYTTTGWQTPAPSFVLLAGGGNSDPKGYCIVAGACPVEVPNGTSPNSTLIPPFLRMVDPYIGETASDNRFVSFHDNDSDPLTRNTLPNMSIGRLPADSTTDVTALAKKILKYENPPQGAWRYTSAYVTDTGFDSGGSVNRGGNFWFYSDEIACNPTYSGSMIADRIYYNPYGHAPGYSSQCSSSFPSYPYANTSNFFTNALYQGTPNVKDATIAAMNAGRLFVNYIGHGATQYWGDDQLLMNLPTYGIDDLGGLANGDMTPIMLELTCNTGYFINPYTALFTSLAKANVNLDSKGAVAAWAAVGQGLVTGHDLLEKGFFDALMNQGVRQLGPLTTAGKARLYASGENLDLIDTTILFGDPASRVALQRRYFFPLIEK